MIVDEGTAMRGQLNPPEVLGDDSISYHVQLSTNPNFSTILLQDSTLIDTTYQLDSLNFGSTYYWRVRGRGEGTVGPWSETWQFMTPEISSISCQETRRLQARCQPNGNLRVGVFLGNFNHAGKLVVVSIDGVQYLAVVGSNRRAQIVVPGLPLGTHTVELVNPGGCLNPVNVVCGAALSEGDNEPLDGESLDWGTGEEELLETDIPLTTELLGTYPNPFNSVATFSFQLAEQLTVDLKIFDILGREVATIVREEELPAGRYSRTWTATGHASGLYLYRFVVGTSVRTGKLLQIK
jgi:hypothetical protein